MMRSRLASVALIALVAFAFSACGGNSSVKAKGQQSSGIAHGINEVAGATATASPSSPTGRGSGLSTATSTPTARASTPKSEVRLPTNIPKYAKGTQHAPLSVEMSACVARAGTQQVTIRSAPGLQLSWATMWADGEPHRDWAAFGIGVIPATGVYTTTFPIRVDAPLGETRTDVAVAGQVNGKDATAYDQVYWTVAKSC